MALFLKYLTWTLTVGVAFAGSWFFEFTKTDPDTRKKTLTAWGRRGIVVSVASLLCALSLTIWTDVQTAQKEAAAAEQSHKDRMQAENDRAEEAAYRKEMKASSDKLLSVIAVADKYDLRQKRALGEALDSMRSLVEPGSSISALEEYRRRHPDLYDKLVRATNLDQVDQLIDESILRQISKAAECQDIPIKPLGHGAYGGDFVLTPSARLQVLLAGRGVDFGLILLREDGPLKGGYKFVFADGTTSPQLQCRTTRQSTLCRDDTRDVNTRTIYEKLQQTPIARVEASGESIEVNKSVAARMRRTFSCLAP